MTSSRPPALSDVLMLRLLPLPRRYSLGLEGPANATNLRGVKKLIGSL